MARTYAACVLRDAEHHPLTKDIAELRFGPSMAACHGVLGADSSSTRRALPRLVLGLFTWRTPVREGALEPEAAVGAMVQAIDRIDEI